MHEARELEAARSAGSRRRVALLLAAAALCAGCQRESPAQALRARFPDQAERLARLPGFAASGDGFERALRPGDGPAQVDPVRAAEAALAQRAAGPLLRLPARGGDRAVLTLAGGLEVRIVERGASGAGTLEGSTVAYRRAGGGAFWSAGADHVEEWILTDAAGDGPVAEWEVAGATLRQRGDAVELLDGAGQVRGRVVAPVAWRPDGSEARAWLRAERGVLALHTEARGMALVDPVWLSVDAPLHWHRSGTATLLPTGKVLLTGGIDAGLVEELFDPAVGAWTSTGHLNVNRSGHSATVLRNGKVLVLGGYAGTAAELFDPATQTWSYTGATLHWRTWHSATLLASGKVLVAGGVNASGGATNAAELYDPATETWAPTGAMASARSFHTATLLPDSRVLVTGGGVSTAELYDPATGTWSPGGSLPEVRSEHSATLLADGRVLISQAAPLLYDYTLGAFSPAPATLTPQAFPVTALLPTGAALSVESTWTTSADAEVFDPVAGTWTAAGSRSTSYVARPWSAATPMVVPLPDGRVFLAGYGSFGGAATFGAELYDPSVPFLAPAAPLATARSRHTVTLLSTGKVLVAGGFDGAGNATASAELYDPATGLFAPTGSLGTARGFHTATTLASGKVLLAGGRTAASGTPVSSAELYDPSLGTFTAAAGALQGARSAHSSTLLGDGRVLLAGGLDASGAVASAELFEPAGTFTTTGSLRAARAQHAAVLVGSGKVRLLGGAGPGGPLASVEEYDPATGQFAIHSTLVSARSAAGATLLGGGAILVTGGDGGAGYLATAELYPAGLGAAWTLTGSMSTGRASHTATLLPSGKVLVAGGQTLSGATAAAELYDPVSGLWDPPLTLSTARYAHGAAVLPSGRVLLAGGANPATLASAELLDEGRGAPPSRAPSITAASSPAGAGTVAAGGALGLAGTRFTGVSEAGPSQPGSSPTNFPLVSLERADGGPPAYAPLTAFGASSATGTVPRSVLPGPYWARVTVSGVPSNPVLVRVTPPLAITPGNAISPPRGTVVFTTTGGSGGAVTWRVASGPSGGRVDASTLQPGAGVYVAGTAGNVTDVVQATDAHGNVATAMIAVTGPVAIGPATAAVPPRGVIAFSATGGSGTGWDWTLQTNLSGATLGRGTGAYVAGATGSVADVVLVTDALGNAATRTVTVGPGITITASPGTTTVSPRGTLTFSASGGQGSGYAWTLSTNASGGTVDASGVYVAGPVGSVNDVVTATDPLGNVATFTVEVSAPVTLTPAGLDTTPGGSRQFTASGGSGTGWSWSLAANGSSGSLTPSTGYYTAYATYRAGATGNSVDVVQVTDSLGNRAAATIRVGAGVSVTPAAASVQVGRTVALRASGGNGSYAWAVDPPNAAGGWVWYEGTYTAGQVPGTDVVRVHDGNQSAATATITVVPTLVVSPAAPTVVARTAQRFTAAGGQPPHRWSVLPGGTSGGTIDPSGVYTAGASAGADTVQVEDALGNTATAAVTVQAPLLIAPKATGVAVNGTVTFGASGGSGTGYAFQLASSGSGSPSLLSSGTYTAGATPGIDVVRVTDSSGNADTATVTVVPVLTAAASAASVPPRGAATFTASGGSGGGYRFDWPPGGNASGATLTSDGRYRAGAAGTVTDTVRVTDGAGATATRTIAVGPSVGVSAVAATVPPGGATDLLASGGGPGPFRWTIRVNRSGGTVDGSSGHYVAGRTGSVPDVVQAEDSLGNVGTCAVSVGAGVTISPPGATVVPGGRFDFTATGGSGTGFAWSLRTAGSGGARVAQNGAYVAGAAGGALDVVAVDDSLGNVGTVAVTVNPALVIVPDTAAVVPRASRDFLAGGGFGAPFTYAADAQSGGLASGGAITADGRYTAGPVGSVVDHVKVTDARGTVARAEIRVLPAVTITPAAPVVAPGEVVDLVALGGSNQGWTWTPTGPTVSGGTVGAGGRYQAGPGGGTAGTTDTISVTDSLGNWAQVQVTVGPVLSVTPGATRVAANGTRTFTAAGGKPPYRWDVLPPARTRPPPSRPPRGTGGAPPCGSGTPSARRPRRRSPSRRSSPSSRRRRARRRAGGSPSPPPAARAGRGPGR